VKFFRITNNEKLLTDCEDILKNIRMEVLKAKFLEEVDLPVYFHFKSTMVLLNVPIYRLAMNSFLEFQQSITANIDKDNIESPLENTPFLYQKWGTLKVLSVVL